MVATLIIMPIVVRSLCYTPETNAILCINYFSVKDAIGNKHFLNSAKEIRVLSMGYKKQLLLWYLA